MGGSGRFFNTPTCCCVVKASKMKSVELSDVLLWNRLPKIRYDRTDVNSKSQRLFQKIAFPLFFAVLFGVLIYLWRPIWSVFSTPESVKLWVNQWGIAAPLIFMGLQIIQVVIFIIPGEVPQIAAGYLFGPWWGTLYSIIGIAAGSAINFLLARILGVPFVQQFFKKEQIERVDRITSSSNAQIGFFLLFLIPGIPKDIFCYAAGLSKMKFLPFLIISLLGRFPGIFGSAYIGGAAADQRWPLVIALSAAAVLLFLAGWALREKLQGFVSRLMGNQEKNR